MSDSNAGNTPNVIGNEESADKSFESRDLDGAGYEMISTATYRQK